jgi:hypothetical protein
MNELCHCGKPLHYTDEKVRERVEEIIKKSGTHVEITCNNITYNVPRHYIALHGVTAKLLDTYGFEVVKDE